GQRDTGDVEGFRRLVVQPGANGRVGLRLHCLGHHIGIEDDHSNLGGSAGALSRTLSRTAKSSSVKPILRPIAAKASPTRTRFSGFTAAARISRTSASVLRPRCAARTRNARCTSSGTFRIVRTAMTNTPLSIPFRDWLSVSLLPPPNRAPHDLTHLGLERP